MTLGRIRTIVSDVFDLPIDQVDEHSSPDSIPSWDSHNHVQLVLALEVEFGLKISVEDATDMLSVRLIRMIVDELLSNDGA